MNILEKPIADIIVSARQRTKFPDSEGLKASIKKFGLINPLTIDHLNNLVAGERRLICCKELGMITVPCVLREELDDESKAEIELEENLHRANLTDEETVDAINKLHQIKLTKYGGGQGAGKHTGGAGWSLQDTADSVGISRSLAGLYIQVAKAKDKSPAVAESLRKDGVTAAYKQLNFERTNAVTAVLVRRRVEALPASSANGFDPDMYYQLGDSEQLLDAIPPSSVDLVFTDPPYGVGVDVMNYWGDFTGNIKYNDSKEYVDKLMQVVLPKLYKVMKEDSFIFFWQPIQLLERNTRPIEFREMMEAAGFSIAKIPFFWAKDVQPYTPNPEQWFGTSVECGIYGYKGKPQLAIRGARNYIQHQPVPLAEKLHPHEKPVDLQLMLIERFVRKGAFVLDPFAGTANVVRACLKGKYQPLAFEMDEDYYNKGKLRLIKENSK